MSNSPPIIDVYIEDMIYEELVKDQLKIDTNRPTSPINRVVTDVLGFGLVYAGTFLVCDIIRTLKTGEWTRLYWMFLGPWNYITGTPLIRRFHDQFGRKTTAQDCTEAYLDAQYEATWGDNRYWETPEQTLPTFDMTQQMEQNARDYKACMEQTREGFAGEGCYQDAEAKFVDCFNNTQDMNNCTDKLDIDAKNCEDQFYPQSCFVDAVEEYEKCRADGKSGCDSSYFAQVYACDQNQ